MSLLASASVSPHERRTRTVFAVWCLGSSRACVVSTSCSPVHVLTHVFSSARFFTCCAWSGGLPAPLAPVPCTSCARRGRCLQSSVALNCRFTHGMVVNPAVPRVLPLSCVAGNTSSLSLCLEGLHTAPFVGLCSSSGVLILVWPGGYTNKKPKSNVFEIMGCRLMMYTDQEPQNVCETRVETDACTQIRNHYPNVFETQGWRLMRVRKQGPTVHTCLKRCLYTTRDHNPNMFDQRAVD